MALKRIDSFCYLFSLLFLSSLISVIDDCHSCQLSSVTTLLSRDPKATHCIQYRVFVVSKQQQCLWLFPFSLVDLVSQFLVSHIQFCALTLLSLLPPRLWPEFPPISGSLSATVLLPLQPICGHFLVFGSLLDGMASASAAIVVAPHWLPFKNSLARLSISLLHCSRLLMTVRWGCAFCLSLSYTFFFSLPQIWHRW